MKKKAHTHGSAKAHHEIDLCEVLLLLPTITIIIIILPLSLLLLLLSSYTCTHVGTSGRDELLGGGTGAGLSVGEEQTQALLDNTETLERTSARLTQGHKIALETEHIGAQILNDLHSQRQTISHSRQRVSVDARSLC